MVVHYKNLNWSNKKTAEEVGRLYNRPTLSHTTVKSIWEKYQQNGTVQNHWNTKGRPLKLEEEDLEEVKEYFDTVNDRKTYYGGADIWLIKNLAHKINLDAQIIYIYDSSNYIII